MPYNPMVKCVSEENVKNEETQQKKKVDIKALAALVPPASALKQRASRAREKRIRLRWSDVPPEKAKINTQLAQELGIGDKLEIAVSGKKFVFTAIKDEKVPLNEVHVNEELMKTHGISDNTIAAVRAHRG
ncbi:hypothetical protein IPA_04335 [Ignicoccus pacificus DSM 13166]|uniref:Uncharacterized protein n=1 Tax=Ignicoccus pacificus DSM 13166 TaxID=940294 RepID=A0A977K9G4_9CREN|nr:hypothetical protein IPA_04335 [Ignicoccus pacificus DSM 13166]